MDKKYYTVAEFAGKKYIARDAFSVFNSKLIDSTLEKILIQLEEKDRQIAILSEQVKFQDEEIKRRSEEILELTKAFREAQALHAGTIQRELTDNNRKWWKFWQR